jgi:hypothetical protein
VTVFRMSSPLEDIMLECSRTEVVIEGSRGNGTSNVERKIKEASNRRLERIPGSRRERQGLLDGCVGFEVLHAVADLEV